MEHMQEHKHAYMENSREQPQVGALAFEDLFANRLALVVDQVRAEARVAPEAYLQDAIVPKGGE